MESIFQCKDNEIYVQELLKSYLINIENQALLPQATDMILKNFGFFFTVENKLEVKCHILQQSIADCNKKEVISERITEVTQFLLNFSNILPNKLVLPLSAFYTKYFVFLIPYIQILLNKLQFTADLIDQIRQKLQTQQPLPAFAQPVAPQTLSPQQVA